MGGESSGEVGFDLGPSFKVKCEDSQTKKCL